MVQAKSELIPITAHLISCLWGKRLECTLTVSLTRFSKVSTKWSSLLMPLTLAVLTEMATFDETKDHSFAP